MFTILGWFAYLFKVSDTVLLSKSGFKRFPKQFSAFPDKFFFMAT